jgi:hypothetical protein
MLARPGRQFLRVLGVIALLAPLWAAWCVWPPQPELRVPIQTPAECACGEVTNDGRSVICRTTPDPNLIAPPIHQIDVFELPTGERRLSLTDEIGLALSVSPGGSRLATTVKAEHHWDLREIPTGRLVRIPKDDISSWPEWTSDDRYVFLFGPELTVPDRHR